MKEDNFNIDEKTLSVDLSDATQAVKDNRFEDAISLLRVILKENPTVCILRFHKIFKTV